MPLHSNYCTPREICYAIQSVAKPEFGKLTARPWNMYEPDTTDSLTANPWLWIDFFVGIRLRIIERPGDKPVWTPSDLWTQFVRHFSPWIGSGD